MSESRILVIDADTVRGERTATLLNFLDFSPRLVRFVFRPRSPAGGSGPPEAPSEDPHVPPTDPFGPRDTGRRTLPARPPLKAARSPAGRPSRAFR